MLVTDVDDTRAETVAGEIAAEGGTAVWQHLDVTAAGRFRRRPDAVPRRLRPGRRGGEQRRHDGRRTARADPRRGVVTPARREPARHRAQQRGVPADADRAGPRSRRQHRVDERHHRLLVRPHALRGEQGGGDDAVEAALRVSPSVRRRRVVPRPGRRDDEHRRAHAPGRRAAPAPRTAPSRRRGPRGGHPCRRRGRVARVPRAHRRRGPRRAAPRGRRPRRVPPRARGLAARPSRMPDLDLDARLDELFATEPKAFTAARDALVRDLKAADRHRRGGRR